MTQSCTALYSQWTTATALQAAVQRSTSRKRTGHNKHNVKSPKSTTQLSSNSAQSMARHRSTLQCWSSATETSCRNEPCTLHILLQVLWPSNELSIHHWNDPAGVIFAKYSEGGDDSTTTTQIHVHFTTRCCTHSFQSGAKEQEFFWGNK